MLCHVKVTPISPGATIAVLMGQNLGNLFSS